MDLTTETILKTLPQYKDIEKEAYVKPILATSHTSFCMGWLCGAHAAVDAILENEEIKRMVYKEVEFQYRVEDAKSHLYDYIEDEDEYKALINSDFPEIVAERFLETHDCNAAENDQFEIIIESMLRERKG